MREVSDELSEQRLRNQELSILVADLEDLEKTVDAMPSAVDSIMDLTRKL